MTRTAADIGRGLAPARPARPIGVGERIHVIGIGGAGASGAAYLAHRAGAVVDGCDAAGPSPYTAALESLGIGITTGHDPAHLAERPDRVAVSKALTAVAPDHPELVAARTAGIPIEPWQQVVADAAAGRRLVAVAGTHGKSTVAGWLVHVLVAAGVDPSALVGALLPATLTGHGPGTGRWGAGPVFVVEADEYAGNFDAYRPDVAILTNVDWDHPDVFADRTAVVAAFAGWLERAAAGRTGGDPLVLIANAADAGVDEVVGILGRSRLVARDGLRIVTTGLDGPADVHGTVLAETPIGTAISASGPGIPDGSARIALRTAGRHNVANALGVLAAALELGARPDAAIEALATFEGVGRRLERKGEAAGVVVYDDYGHHPSAIAATVAALRQREPDRRVWAVYEPLTFHRTAALTAGFAVALATADAVRIADIWAGRDTAADRASISPDDLADAVRRVRPDLDAAASGSIERTAARLATDVSPGDAVLVLGGGRSYRLAELLLDHLAARRTDT